MNEYIRYAIWVLCIAVGLARPLFNLKEFNKHISQSYQAVAHILVGWLLAWWALSSDHHVEKSMLIGLTLIEVACAAAAFDQKRLKNDLL